ncbi:hypothetical protein HY500_01315 [Candidatus Woesearchaeota archaeon]|nr:hypothetical protein [Candidatus Woesearchaeota archaeon]
MKRGQVSIELIVILSLVLTVLLIVFNVGSDTIGYTQSSSDNTRLTTFFNIVRNAASTVYHQGVGAKTSVYVVMPDNLANITVTTRSIIATTNTGDTFARNFDFNITGNFSAKGSYYIDVEAKKGYVEFKR